MSVRNYVLDARAAGAHFPGIGRYVSNLARALALQLQSGEHLHLIRDPSQPETWQLPGSARNVTLWPLELSPFTLRQQWAVPRLLRRLEATVYHSPYYLMPYRPGVPSVLTIYDFIPRLFSETVSRRARLLFDLTTRLALRSSQQVIAISEATKADLLRLYRLPEQRVTAIPLAADPIFQPRPANEIARVRNRYDLPGDYVLYLGINKPHKNLVRLVEAWALLLRELEQVPPLVIAGAWDERYPEVRQLVEWRDLAGDIHLVGPIRDSDLPGLYSGARLFVFPSLYEGFGLPVLEAMACGVPVACADTSSLPEVAGSAAIYFDPASPEMIAAVLLGLLSDPAALERMRDESRQQAARFSWQSVAAATLALYRRAADSTSGSHSPSALSGRSRRPHDR